MIYRRRKCALLHFFSSSQRLSYLSEILLCIRVRIKSVEYFSTSHLQYRRRTAIFAFSESGLRFNLLILILSLRRSDRRWSFSSRLWKQIFFEFFEFFECFFDGHFWVFFRFEKEGVKGARFLNNDFFLERKDQFLKCLCNSFFLRLMPYFEKPVC